MRFDAEKWLYGTAALLALGLNLCSWSQPFFWDTLLTSSVVQHWLAYGPGNLILPAQLDAGHPPLFYLYLWAWLSYLSPQLWVVHFAMFPFTLMGAWAFLRLLGYFEFSIRERWIGLILFFAIPAVSTQYSLVSYDAVLLSLYLSALVCLLGERPWLLAFILVLTAGITGRGLFAIGAIALTAVWLHRNALRRFWSAFIPGLLVYIAWYGWHYTRTGYIFAPDNGWSDQRGLADAATIFRNGIAIARTLFDLGIVILFAGNVFAFWRQRKWPMHDWIWLVPFLLFSISFLFLTNPINHRYYLVVYVLMLIPILKTLSAKPVFWTVAVVILLTAGHFQLYPRSISNGWDCTLAHLPYHELKQAELEFADRAGIDRRRAGTVFPMNTSERQDRLAGDTLRMANINGEDMQAYRFVLYSNVGNDFSDAQLQALRNWRLVQSSRRGGVEMAWFENPAELP